MARSTPTEADLGIAPTDEELTSAPAPAAETSPADDDIPLSEDQPVLTAPEEGEKPSGDDAEPASKPDEGKTVDLRALQEARGESRELKQRNALLEQRLNAVLEVVNRQPQQQEQPQPEAPAEPSADDPVAMINWLVQEVKSQRMSQQEAQQIAHQEGERQEHLRQLQAAEQQFTAKTPDYYQAVNFVAESRDKELQALYPFSTEAQRVQYIRQEWAQIVRDSMSSGLNPAELVYNLAKTRGYSAQPAPSPKPMVDPVALADAQQRHQSLSDAGGGETVAPIDAKALAAMDDKAFNAWLSQKGNDKKLEAILGA